jgi:hypothetical protein
MICCVPKKVPCARFIVLLDPITHWYALLKKFAAYLKAKKLFRGTAFKNRSSHYRASTGAFICCSIFLMKLPLGCAPTSLSTTCPPLMKRIAGMEVMP